MNQSSPRPLALLLSACTPAWGWMAAVVVAMSGCGSRDLFPVSGHVRFPDGTPLKCGRVVVDSKGDPVGSWGLIHPDGSFRLGTRTPDDGVRAGEHRVVITNALEFAGPYAPPKQLIDAKYGDPETSGFIFRVPDQVQWDLVVTKPDKPQPQWESPPVSPP